MKTTLIAALLLFLCFGARGQTPATPDVSPETVIIKMIESNLLNPTEHNKGFQVKSMTSFMASYILTTIILQKTEPGTMLNFV